MLGRNQQRPVDGEIAQLETAVIVCVLAKHLIEQIDVCEPRQQALSVEPVRTDDRIVHGEEALGFHCCVTPSRPSAAGAGFDLDVREEPGAFTFGCQSCRHVWRWTPGMPWPPTIAQPTLGNSHRNGSV